MPAVEVVELPWVQCGVCSDEKWQPVEAVLALRSRQAHSGLTHTPEVEASDVSPVVSGAVLWVRVLRPDAQFTLTDLVATGLAPA